MNSGNKSQTYNRSTLKYNTSKTRTLKIKYAHMYITPVLTH